MLDGDCQWDTGELRAHDPLVRQLFLQLSNGISVRGILILRLKGASKFVIDLSTRLKYLALHRIEP
jgi:hypothetical protein